MLRSSDVYIIIKKAFDENGVDGLANISADLYKTNGVMFVSALDDLIAAENYQNGLMILDKVIDQLLKVASVSKIENIYEIYSRIINKCYMQSINELDKCVSLIDDPKKLVHWIKSLNSDECKKFFRLIKLPEHSMLLQKLFKSAFENNLYKFIFHAASDELLSQIVLDSASHYDGMNEFIADFMTISDPNYRDFTIETLSMFFNVSGKATVNGVLLAVAALYEDNKITMPTLVIEKEENDYFRTLKSVPRPFMERFIYYESSHWMCGEISVDANNHMQLMLMDSLGVEELSEGSGLHQIVYGDSLFAAAKNFDKHVEIYVSKDVRQYSKKGCSIYALDDIRHLQTMHQFIDLKKYPGGFFDYLKNNSQPEIIANDIRVNITSLPLRLLRTMQSKKLLSLMTNSDESGLRLNKKGVTGQSYAHNPPGFFNDVLGNPRNKRLDIKFNNILRRSLKFITRNSYEAVKIKMDKFRVDALKKRISAKNKLATDNPKPRSGM